LFTIGITPTFAATGYGYIKYADGQEDAKRVISFVEKPDEKTALRYLSEGGYLWNSGMFVWKVSTILNKFKRYLPDIYADLMTIKDSLNTPDEERVLGEIYSNIRSISIDYGIMERADDIRVLPADLGWSDVGSWDMLGAVHSSDELGNVVVGDVICEQTQNCVVYSTDKLVATVGVENLVIVQTADAVLVCPKDRAQDVKRIVEKLKTKGREELL
jgi:mannose-1-phosphate guanylyltransferase